MFIFISKIYTKYNFPKNFILHERLLILSLILLSSCIRSDTGKWLFIDIEMITFIQLFEETRNYKIII